MTEKERNQFDSVLKRYGELMIAKMREVEASDWKQPWISPKFTAPAESLHGKEYRGKNQVLLSFLTEMENYQTPVFTTFKKCEGLGVRVKKGQHGFPILNYRLDYINKETKDVISVEEYNSLTDSAKEGWKKRQHLKPYVVFNLDQTNFAEVLPDEWNDIQERFSIEVSSQGEGYVNPLLDRVVRDNNWVCPIEIKSSDSAYYSPSHDKIILPQMEQFPDQKEFYFTALHEMTHSTGSSGRLNRQYGKFGDHAYAREELVAELTSSFIGSRLGMSVLPRKENAQYLKGWLSELSSDLNYIETILNDVNKASNMMESVINEKSIVKSGTKGEKEDILTVSFIKDKEGVVFAEGRMSTGESFRSVVYKRGDKFCFSTGSIAEKNFIAFELEEHQAEEVQDLLNEKSSTTSIGEGVEAEPVSSEIVASTGRKTITVTKDSATVTYAGKEYNATPILEKMREYNVDPLKVSEENWQKMLKGQGLQLGENKGMFSICKTPAGYGMKVISVVNRKANEAASEM